jgi:serine/threonine-protein kinase
MGVVVAAYHEMLDQHVAIKLLAPTFVTDAGAVERFLREARAAAKLQSEHATRIYDVGKLEHGMPYIAMELLDGADFAALLEQYGPMPIADAVDCVLQAIDVIAEAHALGIVHRDIKPANLFQARRADHTTIVKVLDFGIAKTFGAADQGGTKLTSAGAILGSPAYMSPEQIKSPEVVDTRTDIWALGVTLYELVSTRLAFDADTASQMLAKIIERDMVPLCTVLPGVPPAFEAAIVRCLAHKPDGRYASVAELARAIAPFGSGKAARVVDRAESLLSGGATRLAAGASAGRRAFVSAPALVAPAAAARPGAQSGAWASTHSRARPRRRLVKWVVGGSAVTGALVLLVVAIRVLASTESPPAAASAVPLPAPSASTSNAASPDTAAPPSTGAPPSIPTDPAAGSAPGTGAAPRSRPPPPGRRPSPAPKRDLLERL